MTKILYIVNRNPFRGHGREMWRKFCALWPEEIDPEDVIMTQRSGHAKEIAAGCKNYDIIASFGGDGTASDVLSGIMEGLEPKPAMAIFPGGTTNIMAHNLGMGSIENAIAILRGGHTRPFDIMRIDCQANGGPAHKYSFMACNAGFAAVSYKMLGPWMEHFFGAKAGRFFRAIASMIMYKPTHMTVRYQGKEYSGYTKAILIGNTEWILKDSIKTTPGIESDNSQLNVTIIPAQDRKSVV